MKNSIFYGLACLACLALFTICTQTDAKILGTLSLAGLAVGMTMQVRDAELQSTITLPNGAATTAQAAGFDLYTSADGDHGGVCEVLIEAPALVVGDLPDAETMTYDVYHDNASDFSGETLLATAALTQTGAGGVGAAAASARVGLPSDVSRYLRVKATNSGAGDASDKEATIYLVF